MATRRKKRSKSPLVLFAIAVIVLAVGAYFKSQSESGIQPVTAADQATDPTTAPETADATDTTPLELTANNPALSAQASPAPSELAADVTKVAATTALITPSRRGGNPHEAARLFKLGREARDADQLVNARNLFSQALAAGPADSDIAEIRSTLSELADETIFSNRILQDDPLTDAYVIQPGDSLAKIAKRYQVTDDLLALVNGIENKSRIRAGRRIKVINGPFHGTVSKSTFDFDLYLNDTLVKQYKVGLGEDGSTPTGEWVCKNKLVNPRFYPPRGGRIIPGGDSENPLGSRWIGLDGTAGEAVGQERYGLHGTIEPQSIGTNCSMGCIRMHNKDVEFIYQLLVSDRSHVKIVE